MIKNKCLFSWLWRCWNQALPYLFFAIFDLAISFTNLILHIEPIPKNYCQCCDWKKKFNDDALFERVICKDCKLTLCTVVYKRLRKCGSCHNLSGNVKSYVTHQTCCCSLKWPKLNLYSSSYVFDINQVN